MVNRYSYQMLLLIVVHMKVNSLLRFDQDFLCFRITQIIQDCEQDTQKDAE